MSKISGQLLISGQFQDMWHFRNFRTTGSPTNITGTVTKVKIVNSNIKAGHLEKGSREKNRNSRLQVQLAEDRGSRM